MSAGRPRRRNPPVIDPPSLVFAAVSPGDTSHRRSALRERATRELEARHPAGAAALSGGYVRRRVASRGDGLLLCFGVPAAADAAAVAWTAFLPRRLRLRSRCLVLRPAPDHLAYCCLRRGTPVALGVVPRDGLNKVLPPAFHRAPRYLLTVKRDRSGSTADPALRTLRPRRRPSGDPALTASRRPRPAGAGPAAVAALFAAAVTLVSMLFGVEAPPTSPPAAGTGQQSARAPARRPAGARRHPHPPRAVVELAAALSPLGRAVAVEELVVDGSRVRVSGRALGGPGGEGGAREVVAALRESRAFSRTRIVSSVASGEDSAFTVEARHRGTVSAGSDPAGPGDIAAVVQAAGLSAISYARTASGTYQLRARGEAGPSADAVNRLAAGGGGVDYRRLHLSRQAGRWQLSIGFSPGNSGARDAEVHDDR